MPPLQDSVWFSVLALKIFNQLSSEVMQLDRRNYLAVLKSKMVGSANYSLEEFNDNLGGFGRAYLPHCPTTGSLKYFKLSCHVEKILHSLLSELVTDAALVIRLTFLLNVLVSE